MKKRNPISEAHSARGAAGSGAHRVKKKPASERKKKHKGQKLADDSEEES